MLRIALLFLLFAAAGSAALALAGSAPAKEVSSVQVCGVYACNTITDRATLEQFVEASGSDGSYTGPAAPAEYYVVRVTVDAGEGQQAAWSDYYVPGAHVRRGTNEQGHAQWRRTTKDERAFLDATAAGLAPFPAPDITRARVGRKPAADPDSYLSLYRLRVSPYAYPKHPGWRRIRLTSAVPSPWTDGANVLRYLPKERLLDRDGEYVRLPRMLARAVQRAAALR